jgi:hypothetical protein
MDLQTIGMIALLTVVAVVGGLSTLKDFDDDDHCFS